MGAHKPRMSGTKWGLTCATTQIGRINYRATGTTFLVLREQVHNLRWYFSAQDGEISNCATGTVFIIPASAKLSIVWPEPTEVLIGQPDRLFLRDFFSRIFVIVISSTLVSQQSSCVKNACRYQI